MTRGRFVAAAETWPCLRGKRIDIVRISLGIALGSSVTDEESAIGAITARRARYVISGQCESGEGEEGASSCCQRRRNLIESDLSGENQR